MATKTREITETFCDICKKNDWYTKKIYGKDVCLSCQQENCPHPKTMIASVSSDHEPRDYCTITVVEYCEKCCYEVRFLNINDKGIYNLVAHLGFDKFKDLCWPKQDDISEEQESSKDGK